MGGAACWQFATHYSDRWFAANPGAGFSETPQFLKVFQKEELKPTPWEQTLWNLYDCDKWALNLTHCPTIAYSGENDKQKQAADVMEQALAEHGIRLRHVIGKGMGHKYDADSKAVVDITLDTLQDFEPRETSKEIHLETYTLKYNRMHWVQIDALESHWKRATVKAKLELVTPRDNPNRVAGLPPRHFLEVSFDASNVEKLSISFPPGTFSDVVIPYYVDIDPDPDIPGVPGLEGDVPRPFSDGSWSAAFRRTSATHNSWKVVDSIAPGLRKRHNLQGPIDDAFMDSFIFVRPTGTPANEAVGKWADAELTRAIEHWRRHFRGDARVVNDVDLTDEMIQSSNIVLWGDPKSNSVLAKIADKLPIQWTADKVTVGEKSYDGKNHAPILIYPNPLNLNRYVVLNSSFTFRDYAYLNNARQVPMLPDWAIIDLTTPPNPVWPGKVMEADFFDEQWKLKP